MACEPLSVLILSTCLIAFWPCVLPLCFAVPVLPYPMYYSKNETQEASDSNEPTEKNKIGVENKKKPEPSPEKGVLTSLEGIDVKEKKEVKEEATNEPPPERIGPSKGTLVPEKNPRRPISRFDGSDADSYVSGDECCIPSNCKDKNVGGDQGEFDLECDICGRYRANIYCDSDSCCEPETEIEEIIVRPRKKPKMVNKKTKTNKITQKGSGDRCCCKKRFGMV